MMQFEKNPDASTQQPRIYTHNSVRTETEAQCDAAFASDLAKAEHGAPVEDTEKGKNSVRVDDTVREGASPHWLEEWGRV